MQFGIYSLSYISPAVESHGKGPVLNVASFEMLQRSTVVPKVVLGKVKLRVLRLEMAHPDCTHVSVALYREHICI